MLNMLYNELVLFVMSYEQCISMFSEIQCKQLDRILNKGIVITMRSLPCRGLLMPGANSKIWLSTKGQLLDLDTTFLAVLKY